MIRFFLFGEKGLSPTLIRGGKQARDVASGNASTLPPPTFQVRTPNGAQNLVFEVIWP